MLEQPMIDKLLAMRLHRMAEALKTQQLWCAMSGQRGIAAAIGFTALLSAYELMRLRLSGALAEPLWDVGFRALGASLAHSVLSVAVLW